VVNKDFIPDSAATVPVALTCTSGTVTATPLNASEATPAVFTVNGALAGATCTATETVPIGYTADETDCVNVPLGGNCTITNTLPAVTPIPTFSGWGMTMLVALLALLGFAAIRRLAS
ncbi:MAG TPA: IPTL-CTERM sorting domain-containing protein, partial [Thermoanaerobaculia bacterium]